MAQAITGYTTLTIVLAACNAWRPPLNKVGRKPHVVGGISIYKPRHALAIAAVVLATGCSNPESAQERHESIHRKCEQQRDAIATAANAVNTDIDNLQKIRSGASTLFDWTQASTIYERAIPNTTILIVALERWLAEECANHYPDETATVTERRAATIEVHAVLTEECQRLAPSAELCL